MLKAIVEHNGNTLFLEFPCKRMLLTEHLASIGILTPPHEIKCVHDEDAPISVKFFGDSEFESKLAALVSPDNTISGVNNFCDMYHISKGASLICETPFCLQSVTWNLSFPRLFLLFN